MQKIGDIFSEIQEGASVSNKLTYNLIEEFISGPTNFINGLEQCYLKIIKLGSKANKKPIERFEKITEKFFDLIYKEASSTKSRKKIDLNNVYGLFQHFLNFLSNGFESQNIAIKQICAKHISLMLKVFNDEDIEEVLDNKVISKLVDGTISLLKSKQPSVKLLALKIASYIQKFNFEELKVEMIRTMSNDESRDVRKVSLINLQVDEATLPHLLVRTREIDSELRLLVYKKLIKEKIHLANLKLCEIYKIVYDGLLAREEGVREICSKYLKSVYEMFKDKDELSQSENDEDNEDRIEEEGVQRRKNANLSNAEKRKELYNKTKIEILRFLKIFQIEKTLVHPHLYEMMELVVHRMLHDIIPSEEMNNYLREFIKIECKQQLFNNAKPEEIFFFRVVCQYVAKAKEFSDLNSIIEDDFLSLAEFSKVLEKASKSKDLLSVYQLFLIGDLMINSDEIGRQSLVAVIKNFSADLGKELYLEDPEDISRLSKDEFNDIYIRKTQEDINLQQFARSFFDTPIVQSKNDLIPVCITTLRKILDDTNSAFSNFILETIAEINEPMDSADDGNELANQKEKFEKRIQQCNEDLKELEQNLQVATKKTRGAKKTSVNEEADKIEKEVKKINVEKQNLQRKIDDIDNRINRATIRCLHLACSLLQSCKISLNDPGIKGLLSSFIGPCFQNTTPAIKDLSFKCLSLYVLLDKKFSIEYMKIYKEYLDNFRLGQSCEPSLLTAIKAVFDFFLAYNLLNEDDLTFEGNDEGTFDCSDLVERLIALMFEGDILTKKVCVEGFTRLIFNKRMKNPTEILTLLMIIWHDTLVVRNGGHEIIQVLSMFFRTYTSYSVEGLQGFEKALEHFVTLLATLAESKEFEFSPEIVNYELNDDFIVGTVGSIGISILNGRLQEMKDRNDFGDEFTPIEKFFLFLCEESSDKDKHSKFFRKIFEKTISNFTIDNLTPIKQNVLYRYLEHLCSQQPENNREIFDDFLKKLKDDEILADESALERINNAIDEERKNLKTEFRTIFKSLRDRDVIIKKRATGKVESREEEKEDKEASTQKTIEEQEQVEEENEDEEEQEDTPKTKAKGGSKRGRKRKEPQKSKEEEEEDDEEEEEEEKVKAKPDLKKVKRSGRRK